MENSKLLVILRTLSRNEFKELEKFIYSPYFTRGRDCTSLFMALKDSYPKFKGSGVTKQVLFEKIYPGKKYEGERSESILSTLASELYRLAKKYLAYSAFEKDEFQKRLMLLNGLHDKGLTKEFEKELANSGQESENLSGSPGDFLDKYRMTSIHGQYYWDHGDNKGLYDMLMKGSSNAMAFALITGYKFIDTKETAKSLGIETGHSFTDSVLESLDSEKMLAKMKADNDILYPFISANYFVYMMNKEPANRLHYTNLKKMLADELDKFGHTEKYMLYRALETYLVIELERSGYKKEDSEELFEMYKNALQFGLYKVSEAAYIEPTIYRNMFLSACDLDEFEWAEWFINKYTDELSEEFREGMKDFSLAKLFFLKGEYEKALARITRIKYDYMLHKTDSKILQLKIYYELGNYEQAFNMLDTTKHYLNSENDIPNLIRDRNVKFIKFSGDLLKLKTGSGRRTADEIIKQINQTGAVESKSWLIKKLEEII